MVAEKFISITKGLIKAMLPIPGLGMPSPTGGTTSSRYCYSTWLRHLILLNKYNKNIPAVVAELGPGDSLGTGIAALLCGCEKYIALDAFTYGDAGRNVKIFDELVIMFQNRTSLPAAAEFPLLTPYLDNYDFPSNILTEDMLSRSLSPERLVQIRKELSSPSSSNSFVNIFVPWHSTHIKNESIDFVFSQSVLQYVDLDMIYPEMYKWLKPGGMMAHVIDFSSVGMTNAWNGHLAYSLLEWKLFCIGKKMKINRATISLHKEYLKKNNFTLLHLITYKKEDGLLHSQLAKEFSNLSEDELKTHAAYMLAAKD